MTHKPVVLRQAAHDDVVSAVAHYRTEGAADAASRFIASLAEAVTAMSEMPQAGSPRFAHEFDIAELRAWRVEAFPYLVFYVEQPDQVDVWRVLHARRDLGAWLEPEEE